MTQVIVPKEQCEMSHIQHTPFLDCKKTDDNNTKLKYTEKKKQSFIKKKIAIRIKPDIINKLCSVELTCSFFQEITAIPETIMWPKAGFTKQRLLYKANQET